MAFCKQMHNKDTSGAVPTRGCSANERPEMRPELLHRYTQSACPDLHHCDLTWYGFIPSCSLERIQLSSSEETVAALGCTLDSSIRVSGTTLLMRDSACSVFAEVTDEGDLYAAVATMRGATRDDLRANEPAETDLCCAASDILSILRKYPDQNRRAETRACQARIPDSDSSSQASQSCKSKKIVAKTL